MKAENDALKIPLSLGCELLISNEIEAVVEVFAGFVRGTVSHWLSCSPGSYMYKGKNDV